MKGPHPRLRIAVAALCFLAAALMIATQFFPEHVGVLFLASFGLFVVAAVLVLTARRARTSPNR